jgi:hypothetical protein
MNDGTTNIAAISSPFYKIFMAFELCVNLLLEEKKRLKLSGNIPFKVTQTRLARNKDNDMIPNFVKSALLMTNSYCQLKIQRKKIR